MWINKFIKWVINLNILMGVPGLGRSTWARQKEKLEPQSAVKNIPWCECNDRRFNDKNDFDYGEAHDFHHECGDR
jgi:hypothetical protein